MGTVIDIGDPRLDNCRFVDCRSSLSDHAYGLKQYREGHLPGAVFADMERDLSGAIQPGVTGRHPLPDRNEFIRTVGQWGLAHDDPVVAYDDDTGAFAARLWWMMRWLGHENVHVLNGGIAAWRDADLPLSRDTPTVAPSAYTAREPLTHAIFAEELGRWQGLLLDARDPARFRGETEPVDPVAGHIPGAVNAPFAHNLEAGRFRSAEALRTHYAALGTDRKATACYCGSGVTAAHNILAIVHAGLAEPALYPGSWSEWITDPHRPVARGEE